MQVTAKYVIIVVAIIVVLIVVALLLKPMQNKVQVIGVIESQVTSWVPPFVIEDQEDCIIENVSYMSTYVIEHSGKTYYLVDVCPFLEFYGIFAGQRVMVSGILEERIIDVPTAKIANSQTRKETFYIIHVENMVIAVLPR